VSRNRIPRLPLVRIGSLGNSLSGFWAALPRLRGDVILLLFYFAQKGRGGSLTALVDDVEGGVGDVVVFEEVFGRAGERAYEDRMVL
jgi:hypothetical protein